MAVLVLTDRLFELGNDLEGHAALLLRGSVVGGNVVQHALDCVFDDCHIAFAIATLQVRVEVGKNIEIALNLSIRDSGGLELGCRSGRTKEEDSEAQGQATTDERCQTGERCHQRNVAALFENRIPMVSEAPEGYPG